jgi:hypothetical protein
MSEIPVFRRFFPLYCSVGRTPRKRASERDALMSPRDKEQA